MTRRWKGSQVFEALMFRDNKKLLLGGGKDAQFNWNGSYMEGPNPNTGFWEDLPSECYADPSLAYFFYDDFLAVTYGDTDSPWTLDGASGTYVMGAGETVGLGGVGVLTAPSGANNCGNLKLSSTDTAAGMFKMTHDSGKNLWYEARIRATGTTAQVLYVGLADGACTQMGANTTGARNMTDGVYFRALANAPTEIDTGVTKNSTESEVKANAATHAGTAYMKFGMKFDGVDTVTFYIDGTALTNTVSVAATNFPNDVALTPHFFVLTGTTADRPMWIDWIKIVQLR